MDLAATALNLRAARVSMPIVIATGLVAAAETDRRREMIASLIPNTKLLDSRGSLPSLVGWQGRVMHYEQTTNENADRNAFHLACTALRFRLFAL